MSLNTAPVSICGIYCSTHDIFYFLQESTNLKSQYRRGYSFQTHRGYEWNDERNYLKYFSEISSFISELTNHNFYSKLNIRLYS